ncbi:MAG: M20 family metallopeptidase [Bacteroidota bacterium]
MFQITDIDLAIAEAMDELVEIRHHLHAHPELSLKEYRTSAFIRDRLLKLEMELLPPFLETDVVAVINSKKRGRNITLRADMDALPIEEINTVSYHSTSKGVMHACGHDGHTAMLLGAAMILEKFSDHLEGSVRFVFQPGEEVVAAGKELIEKGVLADPKPDVVLALHGWPGYPAGTICSRPGEMMAAADFFKITITGKGGHGAGTDQSLNPIVVASKTVESLSSIPEREFGKEDRIVVSISKLLGGNTSNVIPREVVIEGSARYFDTAAGKRIPALFEEVMETECGSAGLDYTLDYKRPYIATVNDAEIVGQCKTITKHWMGESAWIDMDDPVMSSEDFSYYIHGNPGAMFFLGMGANSPGLHTNTYDFNDQALRNGIRFLVLSTLTFLSRNSMLYIEKNWINI